MKVLISGAGIAGLTAAWWLSKQGHHITIIEVAPDLRDEGYMIDFFGPGYDVAEQMGMLETLSNVSYDIDRFNVVNSKGKIKSGFSYHKMTALLENKYFLLMRGDLVNALNDQLSAEIEIRYNSSIRAIEQSPDEARVTFNNGNEEAFDLVIGADGIHSRVREVVFGDERQYLKYMGYHVAVRIHNEKLQMPDTKNAFYSLTVPDKQAVICPLNRSKYASFFVWRTKDYPHLTEEEKHGVLKGLYENVGWVIPRIVNKIKQEEKLYFDSVSQIRMAQWYKDRVVLIGDAAYCLSLMAGQGASLAMAGAWTLAKALEKNPASLPEAFWQYQKVLQPQVEKKQGTAKKFSKSFVPQNRFAITVNNLYMKVMFLPPFVGLTKQFAGAQDKELHPVEEKAV